MIGVIRHRGPDDCGFYRDEQVGLSNARLSIIDIEGGHQPQHNEEGTVHVTYNGEIYNFQALRSELEKLGHRFSTKSDTEVIVHGYEQYGDAFIQRLNGMFAIALWDSGKKRLLLARDRMGIKPLYYALEGDRLLFGSEMKALLQANLKRSVDCQALYSILNVGYIPGSRTLMEAIRKLPPSTILTLQDGQVKVSTYWNVPSTSSYDEEAVMRSLRVALQESVRDQLVADVPVGCFLSGGLDTSTLVAFASRVMKQPLKTFCMGFGEETDEFRDAQRIAERFETDHNELTVDSSQAVKLYPKMIWHMEAPKYNLYPWFVCELVKKHVTVCLSGNGGDEIFGGYVARYMNAVKIEKLTRRRFSPILRAVGAFEGFLNDTSMKNRFRVLQSLGDGAAEYLILAGAMPYSFNYQLFKYPHFSAAELRESYDQYFSRSPSFVDGIMQAELRTKLVDDLLSVDDTMSMAHSLELRVPLLDNRIVDLMMPMPWQSKFHPGGYGKLPLRRVMKELLPKESLRKPKWGFSVNVYSWYRGELGELVRQVVPESNIVNRYFLREKIRRLIDRSNTPKARRYQVLLWQLLGFHYWHKLFIDGECSVQSSLGVN
jgi:asparagine synthase (glutamine-hydrolysing)